jgi:hypothetical protein
MTVIDDRLVLHDAELVELVADEPELLAILDAYASTQQPRARRRQPLPLRRLGLIAAAAAVIAVPAAAFADQIGQILGLTNSGTPIAETQLPDWQLSALQTTGFPTNAIHLLGKRDDISFYISRQPNGGTCFAIGLTPGAATTRIDALSCGSQLGSFPSSTDPIADFSASTSAADGSNQVTRMAGFAADPITSIALLDAANNTLYTTPVVDNIYYAASGLPAASAASIAALDSQGRIVYRKQLTPPLTPAIQTPDPAVVTSGQ